MLVKKTKNQTPDCRQDLASRFALPVYNFVFRMTADSNNAQKIVEDVFSSLELRQQNQDDGVTDLICLLGKAFESLQTSELGESRFSFNLLDLKLRSEKTRTDIVRDIGTEQRDYYLWELKQGCMTSVVNCLPFGERAAFVLKNILSLKESEAAYVLNISLSAFRVRLSRASQKITNYLAPRCEHVDPNNPCRCPSRLGVALANGFIRKGSTSLRPQAAFGRYGVGGFAEDGPLREIEAIYSHLPDPQPKSSILFSESEES